MQIAKIQKNKWKKQPEESEYVADQINSLILQLDLRRFYWLMFATSQKWQYAVVW